MMFYCNSIPTSPPHPSNISNISNLRKDREGFRVLAMVDVDVIHPSTESRTKSVPSDLT